MNILVQRYLMLKSLIIMILVIIMSFVFFWHLNSSIQFEECKNQFRNTVVFQRKLTSGINIESVGSRYQDYGNGNQGCPYYDAKNGLFHPGVEHPRFIVTGGAGFIGSHLVKYLRQRYKANQIKVLDNLWRGRLHNLQYKNGTWAISTVLDFCLVDLRNAKDTLKFVKGADVIFHLADVVAGVSYVFSHQSSVFRDNILINTNTLYAAKTNKVQNFIYVGTACSFPKFLQDGPGIHALKEEQTYPADPESSYGWSKLMGEYEVELAKSSDFHVGILRLHNVYGPNSDYTASTGQAIPSLIRKALKNTNGSFIVWGSGTQYRDFIYVDDVVDGLVLMLEKGMNKGVIQVGTGKATTIKELAHTVKGLAEAKSQKKMEIMFDTSQPEGDRGRIAILDRARDILGWRSKVDLIDGIATTMSWIAENQIKHRILVIVIGQQRVDRRAWNSFYEVLIRSFNAHLAIYTSDSQTRDFLYNTSQYVWTVPEYNDWSIVFDMAAKACNANNIAYDWRKYCKIPGTFMGGISNCIHPGSAGILLAFRWLVQQKIAELKLVDKYDWFILTQADELHLSDHYKFSMMNQQHSLLSDRKFHGGWSDHHIIGRSLVFMKMINITTELICKSGYWFNILRDTGGEFDLERTQKILWSRMNITVAKFSPLA